MGEIIINWTRKPYSRAANKFYCFSAVLEWSFSNFEKYIGARPLGFICLLSEPIGNNEGKEIQ
jgi:hypothetical protein